MDGDFPPFGSVRSVAAVQKPAVFGSLKTLWANSGKPFDISKKLDTMRGHADFD